MKKTLTPILTVALFAMVVPINSATPALAQTDSPAALVPAEAPFYAALGTPPGFDTNLDQLIKQLGGEPAVAQALDELAQEMLFDRNASFAANIRPWLGDEIGFAVTSMPSLTALTMSTSDLPPIDLALVVEVTDPAAAEDFLNLLLTSPSLGDITVEQQEYGGYTYNLIQALELSLGIIDNYLVVAYGPFATRDLIDVANGGPSLAAQRGFARVYGSMPTDSLLRAYVGSSLFTEILSDPLMSLVFTEMFQGEMMGDLGIPGLDTTDPRALQQQLLDIAETFDGMGIAFYGTGNALVMDLVAGVNLEAFEAVTGQPAEMAQNINAEIFTLLPADTLGVWAATNLGGMYEAVQTIAMFEPESMLELLEAETAIEKALGQRVKDLLSWMRGSFALSFGDNPDYDPGDPDSLPVNLVLVVEVTDLQQAQVTLDGLTGLAKQENVPVEVVDIDGVSVTNVFPAPGSEEPVLQMALVDGYFVATVGNAMSEVIETARGGANYTMTPQWQQVTRIANAEGPGVVTLELAGLADLAVAMTELQGGVMSPSDREFLETLSMFETAAIIAPAVPDGGPARLSFIITLAE